MSEILTDYAPREQCCHYTDSSECDRFGGPCPNDVCIELDAKDATIAALATALRRIVRMSPEVGAKLERAREIAQAAIKEATNG